MSIDSLIVENMDLSHIHLAVLHSVSSLLVWSGAEIKCTVHNALPKPPHKLVQQSRQKALKAYCTNMYTVLGTFIAFCTHGFGGEI